MTSSVTTAEQLQSETVSTRLYSVYADDADFEPILNQFLVIIPDRRKQIEAHLENGDVDQLKVIAHQLKGAGGGYGFPQLTEVAAALESLCKQNQLTAIPAAAEELVQLLRQIAD
ncbi:MAG: Hpt domain-containing protein [Planctomycetaceae bacterium]|nr:Hpt domain-containing protein [Planctomycetaceae bacterium]